MKDSDSSFDHSKLEALDMDGEALFALAEEEGALSETAIALDDHTILGQLGRGGMGIVYRAREEALGREVALKMIRHGRLTSRGILDRFRIEAQTAARLDHPNILSALRYGDCDGQPFYTMKLIEGARSIEALTVRPEGEAARPVARQLKQIARTLATVADAVEHAHQHGVLHRDLKPSNVLLD